MRASPARLRSAATGEPQNVEVTLPNRADRGTSPSLREGRGRIYKRGGRERGSIDTNLDCPVQKRVSNNFNTYFNP